MGTPSIRHEWHRDHHVPRIRPTRERLQGVEGTWALDGRRVHLQGEPETGVLVAFDEDGTFLNPMEVISRGRHMGRE